MNALKAVLMRKLGPLPVWVYFIVGVLGVAFILKRRTDSQKTSDTGSDLPPGGPFPDAQPMNYSSDIFVNIPAPIVVSPSTPAPVLIPRTRPDIRPVSPPAGQSRTIPNRTLASTGEVLAPARETSLTYVVPAAQAQSVSVPLTSGARVLSGVRQVIPVG